MISHCPLMQESRKFIEEERNGFINETEGFEK